MSRRAIHQHIFNYSSLGLAACIPLSAKGCVWCLLIMAANWLMEGNLVHKIKTAYQSWFVVLCSLFFLLEIAGLFYTHHFTIGFYHAQKEASFFVIPLLFFSREEIKENLFERIMMIFCLAVFLASLYCVILGILNYEQTSDMSYLFYHTLVAPIHQHAIYFSVYTFICIVYLFNRAKKGGHSKKVRPGIEAILIFALLIYFSILLFFLRSKMVVGVAFIYAVYQFIINISHNKRLTYSDRLYPVSLIILILAALFTPNPFSRQMKLLKKADLSVLQQSKFDPGDRFDEISIRLTAGKFGIEILNEKHAWMFGVSPGDARHDINHKIISSDMFTGYPGTENHGFLNYNLQNQYLQTLVNSGITGLVILLSILFVLYRKAVREDDTVLLFVIFAFTAFFLTESVFERQMGIVPFFFFISMMMRKHLNPAKYHLEKHKYEPVLENIC